MEVELNVRVLQVPVLQRGLKLNLIVWNPLAAALCVPPAAAE